MKVVLLKVMLLMVGAAALGACGFATWQPMKAQVPSVVYVTEPCRLPRLQALPPPVKRRCDNGRLACYDSRNAELLASRLAAMKRWIGQARRKCGIMEYRQEAYHLLPPYRRSPQITASRLRLTAGMGSSSGSDH